MSGVFSMSVYANRGGGLLTSATHHGTCVRVPVTARTTGVASGAVVGCFLPALVRVSFPVVVVWPIRSFSGYSWCCGCPECACRHTLLGVSLGPWGPRRFGRRSIFNCVAFFLYPVRYWCYSAQCGRVPLCVSILSGTLLVLVSVQ